MSVYIFAGPTLRSQEIREVLDAVVLPPVSQGDVYRLSLRQPSAIGIIDGRFRDVPAVWHKEILWALNQKIAVFGSASTGALRAAELEPYGMRGVGKIFEAYRDGILEDDDEVAVANASPESDYLATSDAMVNIRVTLKSAEEAGVVSSVSHSTLIRMIKAVFFPLRTYSLVLKLGREAGLSEQEMTALEKWLPTNRINQKRTDALAMLGVMRQYVECERQPSEPLAFHFEHTQFFEQLRRSAGELIADMPVKSNSTTGRITLDDILDELRLNDHDLYAESYERAVLRCLAVRETRGKPMSLGKHDLEAVALAFRRKLGLFQKEDVDRWMSRNHLQPNQFMALLKQESTVEQVKRLVASELPIYMRDQLRIDDRFSALAVRARDKKQLLDSQGRDAGGTLIGELSPTELVTWYFEQHRKEAVPDDCRGYAASIGFVDYALFVRALRREYWYSQLAVRSPESHAKSEPVINEMGVRT